MDKEFKEIPEVSDILDKVLLENRDLDKRVSDLEDKQIFACEKEIERISDAIILGLKPKEIRRELAYLVYSVKKEMINRFRANCTMDNLEIINKMAEDIK